MWKWFTWRYQFRRQELAAFIWFVPLLLACWFLWKSGYGVLAVILLIAGIPAAIWLQWALSDAQLKPSAARSTMAINDPVYDIPLQDDALPSNPASDPLYNTDTDFTQAPPEPDPQVEPAGQLRPEEGNPPAGS